MGDVRHRIVYLSPAGATRRVAERIASRLREHGEKVETLDLSEAAGQGLAPRSGEPACVWVGSPVYSLHALPQVVRYVEDLPVIREGFGVPFVTYGTVTSGTALWDLGVAFGARGYQIAGAAKVLALHSTFCRSPEPLGAGHPDERDLARVDELVEGVLLRIAAGDPPLRPEALDYQNAKVRETADHASIAQAKARSGPLRAEEERCTRCGACVEACPVGAVELDPYPVFGEECMLCTQCVRECPEDAIPFDFESRVARIRGLLGTFGEEPETRVFP